MSSLREARGRSEGWNDVRIWGGDVIGCGRVSCPERETEMAVQGQRKGLTRARRGRPYDFEAPRHAKVVILWGCWPDGVKCRDVGAGAREGASVNRDEWQSR